MHQNVYVKAVKSSNTGEIGYAMLWIDYPELSTAGVWKESSDAVEMVEQKLIAHVKKQLNSIFASSAFLYCTDPSTIINDTTHMLIQHTETDYYSCEVTEYALCQINS